MTFRVDFCRMGMLIRIAPACAGAPSDHSRPADEDVSSAVTLESSAMSSSDKLLLESPRFSNSLFELPLVGILGAIASRLSDRDADSNRAGPWVMQLEKDPDREPNDPVSCVIAEMLDSAESWKEMTGSSSEMELIELFPMEERARAKRFFDELLRQEVPVPSRIRRPR